MFLLPEYSGHGEHFDDGSVVVAKKSTIFHSRVGTADGASTAISIEIAIR